MSGNARLTSLGEHPRAAPAIRRAKALGGLAGFLVTVYAGVSRGAPLAGVLERSLAGGIVAYMLVWVAAVAIWRRVLVAQAVAAARRPRDADEDGGAE